MSHLLFGFFSFVWAISLQAQDSYGLFPVIQGPTNANATQVGILAESDDLIDAYIESPQKKVFALRKTETSLYKSKKKMFHFIFDSLPVSDKWKLRVRKDGKVVDTRYLKSNPPNEKDIRFSVVSCTKDKAQSEYPDIWQEMLQQKIDFLLYIGDTVYIDGLPNRFHFPLTAKHIVKRHIEARETFRLFREQSLVPVYAVWDDHDYGLNNSDMNFNHREFTISIFKAFFPDHEVADFRRGPGVAKSWHMGHQSFILLDNRFYQNQKAEPEVYLGAAQNQWLDEFLKDSAETIWIAGGSQFFGAYVGRGESFEGGFPEEWQLFLERLRSSNKKIAFLSGDIHATELMKIEPEVLGYETYEFTSSGMIRGSFGLNRWKWFKNPRQILKSHGLVNYGVVNSQLQSDRWDIRFEALTSGSKILFEHEGSIKLK